MRVVCCVHGCLSRGDCGQWAAGGVDMASVDDMFDLYHPSRADNTNEVSNYVYINGKMCDVCVCCMYAFFKNRDIQNDHSLSDGCGGFASGK